jgi:hypothetical protein
MSTHSRRLTDPTDAELVAACEELFRLAVTGAGLPAVDPLPFVEMVALAAGRREGVAGRRHIIRLPTYSPALGGLHVSVRFGACWWTDPAGRRHWMAEASLSPRYGNAPGLNNVARSTDSFEPFKGHHPLEFLGPDFAGGFREQDFVVLCRCGFVGTPQSLAWTGTVCGPCRDREEDGLPPLGPPVRWEVGPVNGVFRLPGGELLVRGGGRFGVWDAVGSPEPRWGGPCADNGLIAVSPTGLVAVQTGDPTLRIHGPDGEIDSSAILSGRLSRLFFADGGRRLYAAVLEHPYSGLVVWHVGPAGALDDPESLGDLRDTRGIFASLDGGCFFVVRDRGISVCDAVTLRELTTLPVPPDDHVYNVVGLPDGAVIVASICGRTPGGDPMQALYRWESVGGGIRVGVTANPPPGHPPVVPSLATSPDGRYLARVESNLVLRDAVTLEVIGRFRPARCRLAGPLAFSDDGRLLVVTDVGLAAWPWQEMFGVRP